MSKGIIKKQGDCPHVAAVNNPITEEQALILIKQANLLNMLDYYKEEQLIKNIDYKIEKENFFKQCSKTKSNHTKRQYKNGLEKLEEYCAIRIFYFSSRKTPMIL